MLSSWNINYNMVISENEVMANLQNGYKDISKYNILIIDKTGSNVNHNLCKEISL